MMEIKEPIAYVSGEPLVELPKDLYIPPDALEIFLESFSGPLDVLLYLIRKQNLDILNIPIAKITEQYMRYIALMEAMRWELAAEYLLMAAMLAEIKSRMLLPKPNPLTEDEEDPRAELVRRLQEYEQIKEAAQQLHQLPQVDRDIFPVTVLKPSYPVHTAPPKISLEALCNALECVLQRANLYKNHQVTSERLSVRERMTHILSAISTDRFTPFEHLFKIEEGRMGIVVTLMAVLELLKEHLLDIIQTQSYGHIHLKSIEHVAH